MNFSIRLDSLRDNAVAGLLTEHLAEMRRISPPECVHALDLDQLRQPEVTIWSVWWADSLASCGALKELSLRHGEIKSMRTTSALLRQGVARQLLEHILGEARRREYERVSLETGSQPEFKPAINLYRQFGFEVCPPFADYREDPNSVFMSLALKEAQASQGLR